MRPSAFLALAAGTLLLAGCSHTSARNTTETGMGVAGTGETATRSLDLLGTAWTIEQVGGQPVLDPSQTSLRFDVKDHVSGATGCNHFGGRVTVDGDRISFPPMATTHRACEQGLMGQEERILGALGAVRRYSADRNGALHLLGAGGEDLLLLKRAAP